jgi:hypothetical protein
MELQLPFSFDIALKVWTLSAAIRSRSGAATLATAKEFPKIERCLKL